MIFRKVNGEAEGAEQFSRADAGAPGHFSAVTFGGGIQVVEVIGHEPVHLVGCLDLFSGFFLFSHVGNSVTNYISSVSESSLSVVSALSF